MSFVEEAALSAFFNSLLTKLSSSEVRELATEKKACRKELKKWEEILRDTQPLLNDAEVKQWENRRVKEWLAELQHLACDMDEILDVVATKSLERKVMQKTLASGSKVGKFVFNSFIMPAAFNYFNTQMMSKMEKITHRLQVLAVRKCWLPLREISGSTRISDLRPPTTSLVDIFSVIGREKEKAAILKSLLNNTVDDDGVAVICIVGMVGIGKTTLAQFVYNDDRVKGYFDFKAWVNVTQVFDIVRITKSILEGISCKEYGATDLRMLQVQLKEMLYNKRFLLVLDDVQNENYADWQIVRSPLEVGAPGSKILITTRNNRISEIMGAIANYELQPLPFDDCISILARTALVESDFSGHPDLEKIGGEIVEKINGLPMAAVVVGGLLRGRLDQNAWKLVLSELDETIYAEGFRLADRALQSTYRDLSSGLKQCFAYCSIFPKDYAFREEEIVLLWMAEGFLSEATSEMEMEKLGGEYFKELIARSIFMRSFVDKSRFVMHDLIHRLAASVAGTTCFRMEGDRNNRQMPERIRYLSYDSALIGEFKNFKSAMNLRTFIPIIQPPPLNTYRCIPNDILLDLLPKLKFLRTLCLRQFSMSQLPDCIGDLRHLRYLDFSDSKIKSLPDSVCALFNLQTLLLRQCRNLKMLPSKIGNLISLRHLDITETFSLRGMPIQIGELTNLRTLSRFVLAHGNGIHIKAMRNFLNLEGELSISGLENILATEDASEARLGAKSGLKRLKLQWSESFDRNVNEEVEANVLDALKPPTMLEELTVESYGGTSFPNWVGHPSFSRLLFLELKNCKSTSMPSIGQLPQLGELCIRGCNRMNSLGAEFYGDNLSNAFLSLETLCFEDMLEWKEWNPCEVDKLKGNFPRLRQLSIISCPKLSGTLPSCLPSLEKLVIRGCKELDVSLSTCPDLRELEINGCKNLVHRSAVKSSSLREVSVSDILKLTCLTEKLMLGFRSIKSLKIDGCKELISFWPIRKQSLAHMGSLDVLKISDCPNLVFLEAEEELQRVEIPCSVNYLDLSLMSSEMHKKLPKASRIFTSLKELRIERCPKLVSFSEVCFPLTLKKLMISHCKNLQYFLQDKGKYNINNNSLLEHLEIEWCPSLVSLSSSCELCVRLQNQQIDSGSKLVSLSSSSTLLAGIKLLRISYCPELLSVSGELLVRLQRLHVWNCWKLIALSQSVLLPGKLKRLQIINCPWLTSIAEMIHDDNSLEYIGVIGCKNIQSLPQGLDKLRNLQGIELVYCPSLAFPESWLPTTNLKELQIDACENLQTLPNNFHDLISLERLEISNCCLPEEGFPINLKSLSISQPKTQKTLKEWELHKLTSLEILMIEGGCPNVVSFPPEELEMILPTSLVQLTVKDFPSLRFLSSKHFAELKSIKYLSIMDCPKVMSLPKKDSLSSLSRLHIDDCPLLRRRCFIGKLEWHKIAHIPYVRIDDKLHSEED